MNKRVLELVIAASNKAGPALKAVGNGLKGMADKGSRSAKVLNAAFKVLKKTLSAIGSVAKAAFKSLLIPLALMGVGLIASIHQAAEFEQSMANVQSVLGGTTQQLQMLSTAAREMGKTSVFSAQEAASAMYDLASAGFDAEQVVGALKGTMLLAAATASELTFTTETMTATIKQFGLEAGDADRVANAFAATISFSKMNMDRLSTSMAFAGPVAAAFGHKLEATLAVLAQFANLGLRSSMIGTTFRMGLLQLQKAMPIDEIERGADVLNRLKIKFKEIDPSINSVAEIVEKLHGKVTQMSEAVALFGTRAAGPWLKLIKGGAEELRKFEKRITDTNKAAEMARIQIETFKGSWRLFISAVKEAGINLGKVFLPYLRDVVDKFTEWVNILNTVDLSKVWESFKAGTNAGVEGLDQLLAVFKDGGAFRVAVSAWAWWIVDVIAALSNVIWTPLETQFKLMFMRIMADMSKQLGGTMLGRSLGFDAADAGMMGKYGRISQAAISNIGGKQAAGGLTRLQNTVSNIKGPVARTGEAFTAISGGLSTMAGGKANDVAQGESQLVKDMKEYISTAEEALENVNKSQFTLRTYLRREIEIMKVKMENWKMKNSAGIDQVGMVN